MGTQKAAPQSRCIMSLRAVNPVLSTNKGMRWNCLSTIRALRTARAAQYGTAVRQSPLDGYDPQQSAYPAREQSPQSKPRNGAGRAAMGSPARITISYTSIESFVIFRMTAGFCSNHKLLSPSSFVTLLSFFIHCVAVFDPPSCL